MADVTNGPWLRQITLLRSEVSDWQQYPFSIPAIASLHSLALSSRVTCFVGENGTGKSTLLEGIALASGFGLQGGTRNFLIPRPDPLDDESQRIERLADVLRLRWSRRQSEGFFLRAESFYNAASYIDEVDAVRSYGGFSLHKRSHGESFLTLVLERFRGGWLYLLDEPEAALSAPRQLALIVRMHDLLAEHPGTQFVVATHSPILLAFPNASILSFDSTPIREIAYRETDAYVITRRFLDDPGRMLGEALDEH
jgi:predicted ATPase